MSGRLAVLRLEPLPEPAENLLPDAILFGSVFDTVIDVGIVIYFDDVKTLVGLFHIDSIEPIAHEIGALDRRLYDAMGDLIQRDSGEAAFELALTVSIFDHLPVAARHPVLASEDRFPAQHTDPPVEGRRHEFLGNEEIGMFEHLLDLGPKRRLVVELEYSAAERAVGDLEHDRKPKRMRELAGLLLALHDHRLGRRHARSPKALSEVDFVGAADHRLGI